MRLGTLTMAFSLVLAAGGAIAQQTGDNTGAADGPAEAAPGARLPFEDTAAMDRIIDERLTAFREWIANTDESERRAGVKAKANDLMRGMAEGGLNAAQLERLLPLILSANDRVNPALARLGQLENSETIEGLLATTTRVTLEAYAKQKRPDAETVDAVVSHPALGDAVGEGRILTPFVVLALASQEMLIPHKETLYGLVDRIDGEDLTPEQAQALTRYWMALEGVTPVGERDRLNEARTKVAGALRSVLSRQDDPALVSSLKDQIAQIDGAAARGELVGHEAPDIEFLWTSEGLAADTLSDLRGKVVVIDFWATWCGPCIQSFPNVARLAQHYEGYDVVVLGVTAPQGRHHGADGTVTVTGDDRAKEFALMAEYMDQKNVSWPMAFGENASWTEYGVRGIPHVAIVDAEGVLRHRGLHPAAPMQEKTAKIDALLKEAGKATPGG